MTRKLFVALSLATTLLSGCDHSDSEKPQEMPRFEATTPLREDATITKEYVCQIHAIRHIEVRALERGYLQHTYVDEGQWVNQGRQMFTIMPNLYQAKLQKAKAIANTSNLEYENTKALAKTHVVSPNELALAKAKLDRANADVQLAETHLGFTTINAPFDGIMDHLMVRNGSLLDEGDLLTTLSDISRMWVYFNVPEAEYLDYKIHKHDEAGTTVQLKLANGEVFDQVGEVETIEADFDNKTGNIEFRATFPNPNKLLRHGETGNILMFIPYKNALLIPQKATFEILDKMYVYVVNKDNKLEQRLIKVAHEVPHLFIVSDGLKEDDRILIDGLRKVHSGQQVEIDLKPPKQVLPELELHAE